MKTKKIITTMCIFCAALLFASCTSEEQAIKNNSNWRLVDITTDLQIPESVKNVEITLNINNNTVAGFSGCNHYFGGITITGQKVELSNMASTKMMGTPDEMELEMLYLNKLQSVNSFKIQDGQLVLFDASGKKLLTFAETEAQIENN